MIDTLDLQKYFQEPIAENCRTLFNHLGRYFYAMQRLQINKNDNVLDCSCGQGYGSYNIALNANYVMGLDINDSYLEKAQNNFKLDNLCFENYNTFFKKGFQADKIICIETIEHLQDLNEIKLFIEKIHCCLKKNGRLFLSFPIGKNKASSYNSFHLCEPDIKSIYDIMKPYFNRIEFIVNTFVNNYNMKCDYCFMEAVND
ncbi:MAG TPA: methyltransferase domain-containing protein [Candidatus Lokiarchaeia archaeon]